MTNIIKIGDKASEFHLPNQAEKTIGLHDFKGKWLILYFYPRDNTPGCTIEAKDFTCLTEQFSNLNAITVGVSKDSIKSHNNFIAKHKLGIGLLSDPDHLVMEKYGVWQLKKMYGKESMGVVRSTFIIDPQGIIRKPWFKVKAKNHAEKVLAALKDMQ